LPELFSETVHKLLIKHQMERRGLCAIWFNSTNHKWYKENWEQMHGRQSILWNNDVWSISRM